MKIRMKRIDIAVITVITVVFLVVIGANINLIFNMISSQTEEVGDSRLDVIRGDLEGTISDAETSLMRVAIGAEQLHAEHASQTEIERFIHRQKEEQTAGTKGAVFNVYMAGEGWVIAPDSNLPEDFHATDRIWYIGAKENYGEIYITEPYMDVTTGDMCFTLSTMLSDHDSVVAMDFNLSGIWDSIERMIEDYDSDALIATKTGTIVGYTDMSFAGKQIEDALPAYQQVFDTVKTRTTNQFSAKINNEDYTVFYSKTKNDWYMILCMDNKTLYRDPYQRLSQNVAINLMMLVIIVALYLFGVRNRSRAEDALESRERFLTRLSGDFKEPLREILKYSDSTHVQNSLNVRTDMEHVRESGIKLSEMIDNLFSYTSIRTVREKKEKGPKVDLGRTIHRMRTIVVILMIFSMIISAGVSCIVGVRLCERKLKSDMLVYDDLFNQWTVEQTSILNMYVDTIAASPEILDDYDSAVNWLDSIAKKYPEISVCYMANPYKEHTVIMNNGWEPDKDFKVAERQWYIDTEKSQKGYNISAPYYDEQTGEYCITISRVVYGPENEFLGIFGIDFYMDQIVSVLGESYSKKSYAFLVDKDGVIINHPNKDYEMSSEKTVNILDTEYASVFRAMDDGKTRVFQDYTGNLSVGYSAENRLTDFYIVEVNDWWTTNSVVIIVCGVYLILLTICTVITILLINYMIRWQANANRKMEESVEEAIAAGKAKSDFLAQMSHEIRTPINAVIGMDEMILRESDNESIREYAVNIQSAGKTLLNLINGILDFSKIESGKMEIMQVKYETVSLVDDLVNMISERVGEKGLTLKTEIDPELPRVLYGDDLRVRQIITNILSNAVKYTREGSITLRITGERVDPEHYMMYVEVQDTGIGIKDEDIEKLFLSFQRLDEEQNRNIEGTGLGLSIVQGLLSMMGSRLQVRSEYGKGSTFAFRVEQGIIDQNGIGNYEGHRKLIETQKKPERTIRIQGANLLVVDDNEMNLKVVQALLKRCGVTPDLCDSGQKCIEMVRKKRYDIIFMDHMMPEMDGIQTLNYLKEEYLIDEDTVMIVLTANAIVGARDKYLQAGFADYLSKPIDTAELEKMLAKYLPESMVSSADAKAPTKNAGMPSFVVELERAGFDVQTAIQYNVNDVDFYREMLEQYVREESTKKRYITTAYSTEDWKNYQTYVHGLKSTSRTIGAKDMAKLALEQEEAAAKMQIEDIRKGFEPLLEEYRHVISIIKRALDAKTNEVTQTAYREIEVETLSEILDRAIGALDDFETDAAEVALAETKGFSYRGRPLDEIMEEIKESLEAFDVNEAKEKLQEIREKM